MFMVRFRHYDSSRQEVSSFFTKLLHQKVVINELNIKIGGVRVRLHDVHD